MSLSLSFSLTVSLPTLFLAPSLSPLPDLKYLRLSIFTSGGKSIDYTSWEGEHSKVFLMLYFWICVLLITSHSYILCVSISFTDQMTQMENINLSAWWTSESCGHHLEGKQKQQKSKEKGVTEIYTGAKGQWILQCFSRPQQTDMQKLLQKLLPLFFLVS